MKELNDIIQAYSKAVLQGKQAALVTVVKVVGSSYRRPGARMLVTQDGAVAGAISGGCLEGDALRKAQFAMFEQRNKLEIYDTTNEEDGKLGIQLGCNGIVYILFEPIDPADNNNPIQLIKRVIQRRQDAVLVTVFNENKTALQKGTCCYVNRTESILKDERLERLTAESNIILGQKVSEVKNREEGVVLYQFIPPAVQLIIVGAGNDAQPLTQMAAILGWHITVVDGRPAYATSQRFPKANKISIVKPIDILSAMEVDEQTAVVLMTHNYLYDLDALERLVASDIPYIGVLGPRKKLDRMIGELHDKGIVISNDKLNSIYGPVGLDIGAETSEEIALSVISEVKAVFSKRQGASLKGRIGAIHNRTVLSANE